MNRVATWTLGSISGVLLALVVLVAPVVAVGGYGVGSSCTSTDGQPCTTMIDQLTVSLPQFSGATALPLAVVAVAILIGLPAWIATPLLALRRGSSARTAILIVAVIASALLVVITLLVATSAPSVLSAPQVCLNDADPLIHAQTCYTGAQAFWVALIGVTWAPIGIVSLLGAPAWVMTLTQTARLRQWGWFVFALLLSPFAALLYAFFGASRPSATLPSGVSAP